ncbi:MAG: rRNA maturation RNase YbeY [Thiotrichaceae bacterium]
MIHAELDVQYALDAATLPTEAELNLWVNQALQMANYNKPAPELTIRIVDEAEGRALNQQWRQRDDATNVLSFPFECPPEVPIHLLGDIVLCAPVVAREAREQGKILSAHWAHLTIHGVLHLLGHDHLSEPEAQQMEALEISILQQLNYQNPYF